MSSRAKLSIVIVGAIGFSVLGIQAADTLRGLSTGLTALVGETDGPCGAGAVQMLFGDRALCVDKYEASASAGCSISVPGSHIDTQTNLNEVSCQAVSQSEIIPWRFISLTQAQQLCARSNKRLPTNEEWYKITSGLADQSACVVNDAGPALTGTAGCIAPAGVHDMVGNVWEWVDGEVRDGHYAERPLPDSGYVSLVDSDGVVLETSSQAQQEFGDDYAWTKSSGVYGIVRGGFYGSETDAGIFAQNMSVALDTKTSGIGFRCVRDM